MSYEEFSDSNQSMVGRTILVVDDHRNIRVSIKLSLENEGAKVIEAENCSQARAILFQNIVESTESIPGIINGETPIHCILMDIRMPDGNGLDVLQELKNKKQASKVIMISGEGTLTEAYKATQLGAFDYIEKPFPSERLVVSVRRCLDFNFISDENHKLQKKVAKSFEMIGEHPSLVKLNQMIQKIATTQSRVLILGESGTGKELVAKAIHMSSTRANKSMIKVNCAAIAQSLMESELFGHEKGAFTGAVKQRRGFFEQADGGTLFLDEIGELNLDVQAKLLRVLQNGELQRVGSEKLVQVDVRVLAATHRDLKEMVEDGSFREDLYYRLNVVSLQVPPLRERKSDIPLLSNYFLEQAIEEHSTGRKVLSNNALSQLMAFDWPGNIRQLKNLIEKSVILAYSDVIEEIEDLSHEVPTKSSDQSSLDSSVNSVPSSYPANNINASRELSQKDFQWSGDIKSWEDFHNEIDRAYIALVLQRAKGNVSEASRILCLERAYLHRLMKKHNIQRGVSIL